MRLLDAKHIKKPLDGTRIDETTWITRHNGARLVETGAVHENEAKACIHESFDVPVVVTPAAGAGTTARQHAVRSEEHTSEFLSLMRRSSAVHYCKRKKSDKKITS